MKYIDISQNASVPLYKYYENINYAKDSIINSRIHLELPWDYNDVYDSAYGIVCDDLWKIHYKLFFRVSELRKYYDFLDDKEIDNLTNKDLVIGEIIDYLCKQNNKINRNNFIEDCIDYFSNGIHMMQFCNCRVSCFSEVNDSLLMWAYYARNYSGICIRHNVQKDKILLEHCRKVQYTNYYISDLFSEDSRGIYFRKSLQWSHEQEWRIGCETDNEYLDVDSIDAIYLGIRMNNKDIKEFIELGKIYNLEVYRMKLSYTEYKLLFDRIL